MNAYLLLRQVHGASAVVAILLALAVPLLGGWWRRRAAAHMRKATALDRATTLAMLATMLTGVGIASWGGWWPLAWVRLSMGVLVVVLALDAATLLPRNRPPPVLRWNCRAAALLAVLVLMIVKPA